MHTLWDQSIGLDWKIILIATSTMKSGVLAKTADGACFLRFGLSKIKRKKVYF
jgi:hypothetical protein